MKMRKNKGMLPALLATVLLTFVFTMAAPAAIYYVATTGYDSNPGTIGQPWRTIQHAADEMGAGDTVHIRGGTYHENVYSVRSGSAGAHIVFSAYSGETPVIDGTGVSAGSNGFVVTHSYIKLDGLEISNWDNGDGILLENAGYIEISDCVVHHVEGGIKCQEGTHDFVLNRVEMHHFYFYGFDATPYGADCYNGTFNDCFAHTGSDLEQNVDGFALGHGSQHDFVFNRCQVYDVYDGFDMGAGSYNVTLNRCLAHDCGNGGFKLWGDNNMVNCLSYHNGYANVELDYSEDYPQARTVTLQNCTLVDATEDYTIIVEHPEVKSLHMYNCILAGGDRIGLLFYQGGVSNYRGDYNIFHNDDPDRAIVTPDRDFSLAQIAAGDWTTYCGQDAHSFVCTDPSTELFQNLPAGDLHLRAGSIAIDKGNSSGAPSEDYDGNPRPQGGGYDIGAYEYGSGSPGSQLPIISSGDYNGDGYDDIAVFRSSSGLWSVRGLTRVYFGGASDIPVPGDYDGDVAGKADIGIFRPSSGLWAIRGVTRVYFGVSSDTPAPGDYNGDGCCDIGIFRPDNGLWAIRSVTRSYYGSSPDTPVPGDYDLNWRTDIALFRPSTGLWSVRGVTRTYFGESGDTPVPGSYFSHSAWKPGIFRPASGLWAVKGVTRCYFGGSSDRPVPAGFDDNPGDEIAIFRSPSGLWAVRGLTRAYYGASGDIPATR